ncbi:MAG: arginine deiminase-related protein [Chitinophagales bacterium]|nr:arginine deiminase-related protein [Chitinophagales bacterium]MDW8428569.1 arginine deiminase-related protein [Chitinophagales bacterium]
MDQKACCADSVLMVRPSCFDFNPETAATNQFQKKLKKPESFLLRQAQEEFDLLKKSLIQGNIFVVGFQQPNSCQSPDALFPNNWISFHPDRVVLYPLQAGNRRTERHHHWAALLASDRPIIDLSGWEAEGLSLEGTGSLVLDRQHCIAYAALSPRTDARLVQLWCQQLNYQPVIFETDIHGIGPVYHTNVLMSLGHRLAVLCTEAVAAPHRQYLIDCLSQTHEIIEITLQQMQQFCANILLLRNRYDLHFWVMSDQAHKAFTPAQRQRLESDGNLLAVPIPTIEQVGGGSVRCMLAEVF